MMEGAFEIVLFGFVEAIHIELPDETVHFVVSEIFGENDLFKPLDVFDGKLCSIRRPINNFCVFRTLFIIYKLR